MMRRTKGSFIARLASLATVLIFSAFLAVGCGGGDKGDDGKGNGGNPVTPPSGGGGNFKTVKIDGQTWMAENLNIQTANSWCYDDNSSNCATYGRLYTWDAAKTACPAGWRLPDTSDWNKLVIAAGGTGGTGWSDYGAENLKSQSWDSGKNTLGFSALPGGYRDVNGSFFHLGSSGLWWLATEYDASDASDAYYWNMSSGYANVIELCAIKDNGASVRCVQN
jgi:uncharacterized protein (TIGR02145 family)